MVRGEVEVLRRVLGEKRTTGDAQDLAEERDAKQQRQTVKLFGLNLLNANYVMKSRSLKHM